ncbi:hypothetical protein YC2023_066132 [Brassica napus]
MTTGRINQVAFINQGKTTSYSRKHMESGNRRRLGRHILCNQKSNWKTDETRPRPHKRKNLKLGAKQSTGKFTGKVTRKFTEDNLAINLNPAIDSVGPSSPTLHTPLGTEGRLRRDVRGCPPPHTARLWLSVAARLWLSVAVHHHTQDVRGCPTQDLDQGVEQAKHGDQDDQISPTEVQPFSRSRSTDRAVYRIDPRAPGRDLRMDPRPVDQISQTTGVLSRPIRHSRANSQARTHDHREESDSGPSLSFLARLGRTARPDQADHDLSNHFDDFMMINASNYSKGRILKLSEDLGRAISSSPYVRPAPYRERPDHQRMNLDVFVNLDQSTQESAP